MSEENSAPGPKPFSAYKIDEKCAAEGVWLKPPGCDFEMKIASNSNPRYRERLMEAGRRGDANEQSGEGMDATMKDAAAFGLVFGIRGPGAIEDDGTPIEFSHEWMLGVFKQPGYGHLFTFAVSQANVLANFFAARENEDAGN